MSRISIPKNVTPDVRICLQRLAAALDESKTPEFASVKLTDLTASRLLYTDTSKVLTSTDLDAWVEETPNQVYVTDLGNGKIKLSGPQDLSTADHPTFDYINLTTSQGVTGLTTTDHPTFDYITLTTSQGVTGLTTTDHPTFDYIVLSTSQGVTGLGTGDHPTFDYINLSTSQGVTGLTTSDSPTFNNLTLTGTFNGRQLNPDGDNVYDMGESGRRWQDLYLAGNLYGGNIVVADDGTIGSASDPDVMTIDSSGNTTFSVFPITPSAAPDADYEVANKKYVDDNIGGGGASEAFKTITGITNDVVADLADDTLTLASGNLRLAIIGTAATDTITFTVDTDLHNYSWTNVNGTDLKTGSVTQAWDTQLDDIAALAVTNGNFIVGDGANWVAESGDTARVSLGVGTTDSPVFVTVDLTGVTDGYIPYISATGFASGNLWSNGTAHVIGNAAVITTNTTNDFQILGTTTTDSRGTFARFSNDAAPPQFHFLKSRSGTIGSVSIVSDDDGIGEITFLIDDGNDFASVAAAIRAEVDGSPAADDAPGRLVFKTTSPSANSPTTRVTIDSAGTVTAVADISCTHITLTDTSNQITNYLDCDNTKYSTFVGYQVAPSNTGSYNTSGGYQSSYTQGSGQQNTDWGYYTGYARTTGSGNCNYGYNAGAANTDGNYSTRLGYLSGYQVTGGSNNVFIGPHSGSNQTGSVSNTLFIDALNRGSAAAEITDSLLVGSFNSTIASQYLRLNGNLYLGPNIRCDGWIMARPTEVTTTNASPAAIAVIPIQDENTYHMEARIVGVKSDGSARASYLIAATIYRTGAGNAVLLGSTTLHNMESDGTWAAGFGVSATNGFVYVVGVAATTIYWSCTLMFMNSSN
jgi:hypothetical protein